MMLRPFSQYLIALILLITLLVSGCVAPSASPDVATLVPPTVPSPTIAPTATLTTSQTAQLPLVGGKWSIKTPMTTARYNASASVIDGKIYVVGGDTAEGNPEKNDEMKAVATLEMYDPVTNMWTTKAAMPTARTTATAVVNGKLYAIGGAVSTDKFTPVVEAYDPATDTWTKRAELPTLRVGSVFAVVDDKIYAIGGYSNGWLGTVEVYDPATDTWTKKSDMPTPRSGMAGAVVNGKIYVFGGANLNQKLGDFEIIATVEEYDPTTDQWTTKTAMPTGRALLATAVVNNLIYAVGGAILLDKSGNIKVISTVERYDPATDQWAKATDLLQPRGWLTMAVVNDKLYAIGGVFHALPSPPVATVEEFDPGVATVLPVPTSVMTPTNVITTTISLTSSVASSQTTQLPPPPGELVDVGGYRLHLYCIGTGKPTVILEGGFGDWSIMLLGLQQRVAGFTHVCAYDHAGYGWSDAGPQPRTMQQLVTELKMLLEKANVPGPYVLVGHSLAGFHLRLFAHEYPTLVAGMVWIDTTPPDFHPMAAQQVPGFKQGFEDFHNQIKASTKKAHAGQLSLAEVEDQTVPSFLPPAQYKIMATLNQQAKYWDAYLGEFEGEAGLDNNSRAQLEQITTLGNLPLILLVHTKLESPDEKPMLNLLLDRQKVQATISTRTQVIMVDSHHYIYVEQPAVVVAAIRKMVDVVNGTQTLLTAVITATNTLTTATALTQTTSMTTATPTSWESMIDIGNDVKLYLNCMGQGNPTIILDAPGPGSDSSPWAALQPKLAQTTRTCRYDRAGNGKSTGKELDSLAIPPRTQDLERLLDAAGIKPPYVMVGYSFGGAIVLRYARQHLDRMAGLVLVEGTTEPILARWSGETAPVAPETGQTPPLGHLPLAVITVDTKEYVLPQPPNMTKAQAMQMWLHAQADLVKLSIQGKQIFLKNTVHFTMLDDKPQDVIDTIIKVVQAIHQ